MQTSSICRLLALSALMVSALGPTPASAVLERVGPNSPSNFLPTWYQDTTGLTMDFCTPLTQQELVDGWCLILPADVPGGLVPEVFPNAFSGEHFYWAADVVGDWTYTIPNTQTTITSKVTFVQAIEAAFLGAIGPGTGGVFGRVRIRVLDLPITGTYTFYTPWGIKQIDGLAGDRIFDSEDIGINCAPFVYDCALETSIGPFLVPSSSPGGAELAPVTGPSGALYLADPARIGPMTGSPVVGNYTIGGQPVNPNVFAVVAPDGQVIFKSHDFSSMGRIHTDVIPSRVASERASYARTTAGALRLDSYATGEPTIAPRLPAQPPSVPTQPDLWLFSAPCAGTIDANGDLQPPYAAPANETPVQMARNGNIYWTASAPGAVPANVCIKDANARTAQGVVEPTYTLGPVSDQVFVTTAVFDPTNGGSLSVRASSSDQFAPPLLSLGAFGTLTANVAVVDDLAYVTPVSAPPSHVRVNSQEGGAAELLVKVGSRTASGVTLTADGSSPQARGAAVIFTAQGAGATEYLYRFWLNDGTAWTVVRDWSAGGVWALPSTTPEGDYQVRADVWAGLSPTAPDATSNVVAMQIRQAAASGVTLTSSRTSPAVVNIEPLPTLFIAAGQGSPAAYQYRFSLSTAGGPFVVQQAYSSATTWELPASTPIGSYVVKVDVRTSSLVDLDATTSVSFALVAPGPATGLTVTPNVPSPQLPGTSVVLTASASGSSGYQYRFWKSTDGGVTYVLAQNYSSTPTYVVDTSVAINWRFMVDVRTTTAVSRDLFVQVSYSIRNPAATGVTLQFSPVTSTPLGSVATLTATATSNTTGLTFYYRFLRSADAGVTYTEVQALGTTATHSIDTSVSGTFRYMVEAQSNPTGPKEASAAANYSIIPPAATGVTLTANVPSPQPLNTFVQFTATGTSTTPGLTFEYRFWLSTDGGVTYVQKQAYSTLNTYTLPTGTAGAYRIMADVRTVGRTSSRDALTTAAFTISP
jgi:hypothetical protein